MDYVVRKACESDRSNIAKTLVYSFEKVLSALTKNLECMAKVFENGLSLERFYVAEQNEAIIGVIACADCRGRVFRTTKNDCKKHLGLIRGMVAFRVFRSELMRPHSYPATTGCIDVLGVLPQARGKGVAKELLKVIIENNPQYTEFVLDVDSINTSAIKSYTDFGFIEFKRVPIMKFLKRSKIFMKYPVGNL